METWYPTLELGMGGPAQPVQGGSPDVRAVELTEGLMEVVAPLGQTGRGLSSLVCLPVSGLFLLWV